MKSKSFFTTLRHPYYIYTFDYRQSSAGIRVLHYLCHALNLIGEEAYVNCEVTNAKLRTPKLTDRIRAKHCDLGLQPIAVYPEVVFGNPTNAPVVARYILNKPGHLGGDDSYDPSEFIFIYASLYLSNNMDAKFLFIPPIDPKIFNNLDNEFDKNRHGSCFYANKFLSKGGKLTDLVKGATDLTLRIPRSPEDLAAILRRSEVLYCYEPSAISLEAMLCGCPVMFVLTEYMNEVPASIELIGDNGCTTNLDPSGLDHARATLGIVTDRYCELEEQAWDQLAQFVEITQAAAEARHQEAKLFSASPSISDRDPHTLADLSSTLTVTAPQPLLSIIICSIDDERFAKVARNYRDLLAAIPHEIIRINDAKSLCEGYNRGIARSRGEYLIFSHDDIEIWTPDFGQRLLRHLGCCDVVGVAGTDLLVDANTTKKVNWIWGGAGPAHVFGRIIQLALDEKDYKYTVNLYGVPSLLIEGMQALDGVFIAMRRSVAVTLGFDQETFDGFHLYDIDFTYRAFHQGFRIGVFNDIAIIHYSSGRYDEHEWNFNQRFLNKFAGIIPKRQTLYWKTAKIGFQQIDEILAFYADSIQGLPQTANVISTALDEKRDKAESSDAAAYQRWCEQRQLGEGWAELIGIRMMTRWRTQPTFHLVIWCEPGQQTALADTLESLGQQLYGQWGLSILAPFAPPDETASELPNIEWIRVDADTDTALRNTLEASALDWFALLEPGDRLPTHALLTAADYINRYPAWRFIYLDEDQLDGRGERRAPLFRPSFDLDLLLATHYLGDCCLMHRESVLTSGDLPYVPGLLTFQAALRVREYYGRSAIGHIADVLYHRAVHPPVTDADLVAQARRQLVIDYLNQRGIAATVEDALLPGTWRVVYRHSRQPKVSIIILARDAMDWLDRCLRRLLDKTTYPDYEILVVDCGSEVDDTIDLYSELETRHPDRFQVIVAQGPFSISAYRNQGARQARGEVFIFLTGSALTIQAEWVERLLNHALRNDVGIVGARLTTPDKTLPFIQGTAQILGMRGIAGPLFTGLPLRAPGPLDRAQVDQTVSAVSAECMAIRREVFEAVNGFDEAFTIAHADTDLCLRTAMQGYRAVWTPFANLAWLGDYPLATGYDSAELAQLARADAERMFERWLPQLAADPAYNPNLSLAEPRRIEAELTPRWDTRFHDRPRLLGFPMDMSGCALYRVYAPLWLLEHQAKAECMLIKAGGRLPELAELARLAPDTVFYQSTLKDAWLEAMRQYRQFHRSFKVFDLDDLKHDVPDANSLKERLMRDIKYRHRQALQHCDRLIVSTEPLVEACRSWIPDIRVVPNRLERSRWEHLHNQRRAGSKPRVGWAGAQQHHGDLAFITEAVQQTHDEVDWIFFGMCLDDLRPYVKEVHDWVSLDDYPAKLASLNLDVAVAPLENHPFNEAKSNLRILEHGVLGRPMVCTDIYPYQNAPVVRVPNETRAWVEAIRAYVHDLDAAERDGKTLQTWVLDHYLLDDHTDDWLSALRP
ncbi:MAG: glycosyltransferase [Gammaproteobacteria bacterium]|jgi:GT2 family glycosyltransferase|nr:glycosyltransferase [Gammaproteobacteria bacterium]